MTLQAPGRYLYLQEGEDSLYALSDATNELHTGDLVEVVGFPGHRGGNFLLREAVYRRAAAGRELNPMPVRDTRTLSEDLDGVLVKMEGRLLEKVDKPLESYLVLQGWSRVFEARLEGTQEALPRDLEPGCRVAVTGI